MKCDRVIEGLEKKGLIREKGRSDAVGRPVLYATTDMFLKNFGFEDLSELPEIEDLESVMEVDEDYEEEPDSGQLSIDMSGSESMEESDE